MVDLSGKWTFAPPLAGDKQVYIVQTGDYVEVILLEDMGGPGQAKAGDWILRFTISGNSITGDANNEPESPPNNILNY